MSMLRQHFHIKRSLLFIQQKFQQLAVRTRCSSKRNGPEKLNSQDTSKLLRELMLRAIDLTFRTAQWLLLVTPEAEAENVGAILCTKLQSDRILVPDLLAEAKLINQLFSASDEVFYFSLPSTQALKLQGMSYCFRVSCMFLIKCILVSE